MKNKIRLVLLVQSMKGTPDIPLTLKGFINSISFIIIVSVHALFLQ